MVLTTARLTLRPVRLADVDDLVRLDADDGVLRYLHRTPPSRAAVQAWVERLEKVNLRHTATLHLHFDDPLPGTEQGEAVYEIDRRTWAATR